MAVAVKNSPETSVGNRLDHLGVACLLGILYVVASLAVVFTLIPQAWSVLGLGASAMIVALRMVLQLGAAVGLVVLGVRLMGSEPREGLKAGVVVGFAGLVAIAWLTSALGNGLFARMTATTGLALTAVTGVGLVAGLAALYLRTGFEQWLLTLEEQGWFTLKPYKGSQGMWVRRGTIIGILFLAGFGVYSLYAHDTRARDWALPVPFADGASVLLLPDVHLTLPLILSALSLWLAYRVVNVPVFADFLIATEAEMNKVSWTTRKRLVQDTIVVLVTVFLLTVFLFVVDQLWIYALSRRWVGVLQIPETTQESKQKELSW